MTHSDIQLGLLLLILPLLGYLCFILMLFFTQDRFIFSPDLRAFDDCESVKRLGGRPLQIYFGGEQIRFYLRKTTRSVPMGWLIIFHGSSGSAADRVTYLSELQDLPLHIVLAEYPGYCGDLEKPEITRILRNSELLYALVNRHLNKDKLPLLLYGESLGAAVTTWIASKSHVHGMILQSPFTSLEDMAQMRYPFIPVSWLIQKRLSSVSWAKNVDCPVLVFHGTHDTTVPFSMGQKMASAFRLCEFVEIESAGHRDVRSMNPEKFWGTLRKFILKQIEGEKKPVTN